MSEQLMFTKKYQNKIFDGFLGSADTKAKNNSHVHLIISYLYFDIYNDVWDKIIRHVSVDKFASATLKDDCVIIEIKNEPKDPIKFHTHKASELMAALKLSTITQENLKESISLTRIIPTFNLQNKSPNDFYTELANVANAFLMILNPGATTCTPINDALCCIYKSRFANPNDVENNMKILAKELKLNFLSVWISSLELASQLQVNKDFLLRLIAALGNSVALISESAEINLEQLLGACAYYCDGGNIAGVYHECKKATETIATALTEIRRVNTGDKYEFSDKLYAITIMLIAGKLTDLYAFDLESLAEITLDVTNETGTQENPPPERIIELDQQMKSFSGDMLRKLKDRRYEPLFQYVFAMWVLRKEPINESGAQ
ncbi:hypothetical protein TRFO_33315 [Tritrichomonas foetus]|uniref:Uncharacterized protein n=1 Tax=Tritrichomonas foetus TaxID=1144522 RepID=A0A1J4JRD1_9EUKA|nr:hypothetical protein TRFO_33315 [Tritrichomonas foetus]|eukprot:OHT00078.1 hypothetical protein TRFO_33315 [Tritrichomonas foetus]